LENAADTAAVCVVLIRATAAMGNREHRAGERYAIMGFLAAETFDAAETQLAEILAQRGWRDFEFQRAKTIALGDGADNAVRNATAGRVVLHTFPEQVETSG
jgi:hypothetical protein